MRFGSLFSGIGGLDLGLERAGMTPVWQVEIDPYAQRVLAKHWPTVVRHDDVRTFHPERGSVELIAGGFPCQDISVAGKGAGLAGARSGLWFEYARVIDETRPSWVLIENVPALRTRGLRTVLSDLHARGYDAEWDGLSASAFGAPHRRDRLFVIAHARSQSVRLEQGRGRGSDGARAVKPRRDGESQPVANAERVAGVSRGIGDANEGQARRQFNRSVERPHVANADGVRELQPQGCVSIFGRWTGDGCLPSGGQWTVEPDVGRVAHGVSKRVERLRGLGNAVVPQVAEFVGKLVMRAVQS